MPNNVSIEFCANCGKYLEFSDLVCTYLPCFPGAPELSECQYPKMVGYQCTHCGYNEAV